MYEDIFKSYDIRGIVPDKLNKELVYKIGKAYADMIIEELGKEDVNIVVGRDMRLTSPELSQSLMKGITDQGANVIDVGLISTPSFYFAVAKYGYDAGMQISASHNPKEYNGIKVVKARAYPVGLATGLDEARKRVETNKFRESKTKGKITKKEGVLNDEIEFTLKQADASKIKPFKIVIDPANAMGIPDMDALFEKLPCKLVKMNYELDGTFPAHQADPFQEKNVIDLMKRVVDEDADLGIATDGDGDRIFFIDDKGELVEPAILRGIMAKIFLRENPGATICYDIRPGKITYDMIVENGGKPSVTKVGHSLIKAQAIKEGAVFAGESSGHFFVKSDFGLFEMPLVVTIKLLQELSEVNMKFSEYVKPLRRYSHSGEINSEVEDKEGMMKKLGEKYKDGKISWLDGVTVEFKDFWFNVRPSNTEPLLRLNLEAKSAAIMEKKRDEILSIIRG